MYNKMEHFYLSHFGPSSSLLEADVWWLRPVAGVSGDGGGSTGLMTGHLSVCLSSLSGLVKCTSRRQKKPCCCCCCCPPPPPPRILKLQDGSVPLHNEISSIFLLYNLMFRTLPTSTRPVALVREEIYVIVKALISTIITTDKCIIQSRTIGGKSIRRR